MNTAVKTVLPYPRPDVEAALVQQEQRRELHRPSFAGTGIFLIGLLLTAVSLRGESASGVARYAAIGCGVSLALSLVFELRPGITNLLRADLVAMFALYFLLFFEFLFPQAKFDQLVPYADAISPGVQMSLLAFAGIAMGRHLVSPRLSKWSFVNAQLSSRGILILFWISVAIGYFHMLLAVNFSPIAMIDEFMWPRFSQDWAREQFGDWKALLTELGAMIYLVPPLAGVILSRRKSYSAISLLFVLAVFLLTLFYGFTTGTRNIIASYLITFLAAYFYSSEASRRQMIVLCTLGCAVLLFATYYELKFREVGLRNYLEGLAPEQTNEEEETTLYVDYNLYIVTALVNVFPNQTPYIGWQGPLWFVARPIPRALWPDKPDGRAVSVENVFGVEYVTLSATFVGEAYMIAGLLGVVVGSLLVGMGAQYWTQKAFSTTSTFGILIYGSGFLAIVIAMRSMYWFPVAILPTLGAAVVGGFLARTQQTPIRSGWLRAG